MIVDIAAAIYALLSTIIGYHMGLFRMLSKIIALICAILIAVAVATPVSRMIYDINIKPSIEEHLQPKIEQFGIDTTITNINNMTKGINTQQITDYFGSNNKNIFESIITNIDTSDMNKIKEESKENENITSEEIAQKITSVIEPVITTAIHPICFAIITLACYIIIRIILHFIINFLDRFEILQSIQKIGGCITGAILAVATCFFVINILGTLFPDTTQDSIAYSLMKISK